MTRAKRDDRGSASLEFLGILPVLLLIALAGIQLGLVAYTASQAGTAARAAARVEAQYEADRTGEEAGEASVSDWLDPVVTAYPAGESAEATVTMDVPSVIPGISVFGPVTRHATMPMEDTTE